MSTTVELKTTGEIKIHAHVVPKPQRSGKTYFNVRYKIHPPYGDDKWHEKAAKATKERDAERFMISFVQLLERKIKAKNEPQISNIPELFEARLEYMQERIGDGKGEYAQATVVHYKLVFRRFGDFMAARAYPINQPLTSRLLEDFKVYCRSLGHSKNTINMSLGSLLATGHWGKSRGISPDLRVEKYTYSSQAIGLTREQVVQFFQGILVTVPVRDHKKIHTRGKTHRPGFPSDDADIRQYWRLVFSLYFFTGARRSEIARLSWGMIDFVVGVIRLPKEMVKDNADNVLGVLPEDLAALRKMRRPDAKDSEYVFHFEPRHFWAMWRYYLKEGLGISSGPLTRLHSTRHTFATLQLQAGTPLAFVSKMMGHSTVGVTSDIYVHTDAVERRAAAERLRDFTKVGEMDANMDADRRAG
jgi:integrase